MTKKRINVSFYEDHVHYVKKRMLLSVLYNSKGWMQAALMNIFESSSRYLTVLAEEKCLHRINEHKYRCAWMMMSSHNFVCHVNFVSYCM